MITEAKRQRIEKAKSLHYLRGGTMTTREIANHMGVSYDTVKNWFYDPEGKSQKKYAAKQRAARKRGKKQSGTGRPRLPVEQTKRGQIAQQYRQMLADDPSLTIAEAARTLDITYATLYDYVRDPQGDDARRRHKLYRGTKDNKVTGQKGKSGGRWEGDVFYMPFTEENVRDYCIAEADGAKGYVTIGMIMNEFGTQRNPTKTVLLKLVERGTLVPEGDNKKRIYRHPHPTPSYTMRPKAGSGQSHHRNGAVPGTGRAGGVASIPNDMVRDLAKKLLAQGAILEHGSNKIKVKKRGKVIGTLPKTPSSTSPQSLAADFRRRGFDV